MAEADSGDEQAERRSERVPGHQRFKISEPVPEAEDAKVTVLSGFAGYT